MTTSYIFDDELVEALRWFAYDTSGDQSMVGDIQEGAARFLEANNIPRIGEDDDD